MNSGDMSWSVVGSYERGVMSDHGGGVDSVGKRSGVHSVGKRSSMNGVGNWGSVDKRSGVDGVMSHGVSHNRGMMDGMVDWLSNIRNSLSLVSDISDESILMIGVVGHNLNTAIGQLYSVFSCKNICVIFQNSFAFEHLKIFFVKSIENIFGKSG